jgi:hypothetical protein
MKLYDKTLMLSRAFDGNVSELCRRLDLTPRWFFKFKNEEFKDVGVKRIQRLHDYLVNL